jgi:TRAP transporter 4TM/12TM fusion protein
MSETKVGENRAPGIQIGPVLKVIMTTLGLALTLGSLAWAADLFSMAGFLFFNEQHLAIALAIGIPLIFLGVPARKGPRTSVPWYDVLAAVVGCATSIYIAIRYPILMDRIIEVPLDGMIVSAIMFVLCLEGLRRTVGVTLVIVTLFLFAYTMVGHLVPGVLQTKEVGAGKLVIYLGLDTSAMLGIPMLIAGTIVIGFIFFGNMLQRSGGADFFNDLAMSLMGRFRGGSAKISIVASSFFGSISGIVVYNIMATGTMTITMMKRSGYKAHSAAAIESVSSTGGQLMPPVMGAVAFFMAERLQVPYSQVAIAALLPAILYYLALFISADLEAARDGIKAVESTKMPNGWRVLKDGWMLIAPFAVIILGLFKLNLQPEVAALYGSLTAVATGLIRGYRKKRMRWKDIYTGVLDTSRGVLGILMIGAVAGFIIGIMNRTGLGFGFTILLVKIGSANLLLLLLISAILCIIFGMGMPTIGVYLLLSVLIAPSMVEAGVAPMAAHMFILYFGMMSMITPPLAIASFFAASLAKANAMKTAIASMRFGWPAYVVPFLFVATGSLLLMGDVISILLNASTTMGGIWLISIGMTKFLYRPVIGWKRLSFLVTGIMMLVPFDLIPWASLINLIGFVAGAFFYIGEWKIARPASEPSRS